MRREIFGALLAAVAVMFLSDVGHSNSHTSGRVTLLGTDQDVTVIAGIPDGNFALGYYKRNEATEYLPGPEQPKFPPNPCSKLIRVWNRLLVVVPPSVQRKAVRPIIRQMTKLHCAADITRDQGTNPQDIIKFRPTQ